ncbi:MAG: hypothetical protein QM831_02430 [Kofleriaceae bacterium]
MRGLLVLLVVFAACDRGQQPPDPGAGSGSAKPHVAKYEGDDDSCDPNVPRVCMGNDVVECGADGHLGRRVRACHHGCTDGKCEQTCEDDNTKLIYLVSTSNDFLSFDPRKLPKDPFHRIGTLKCPHEGFGSPFSMSVDRNGIAWVLYGDGRLFKVHINDAKCEATGYSPFASGSLTFGMGFSTDKPGSDSEKLFIAANESSQDLSNIDTTKDLTPKHVGRITATEEQNPELTGTSEARLFGFFPSFINPSFIQEINRDNGSPIGKKMFLGNEALGDVTAYAFAQWGGVFYVFATVSDELTGEQNSTVRTVDRTSGKYQKIMTHVGYRISGAGVSTCAPERDASQAQQQPQQGP